MSTIINGRYLLQNKIGSGGMGIVYCATDRLTRKIVALKKIILSRNPRIDGSLAPGATEDDLRLALAHEFQILAGLRHPHIISVLDYGFDEKRQPFFTMTYLPQSQNILDAAKERPLEYKIELIQQLLQALAYLHRRGVLHRDLKPDNVLVTNGVVHILDFGLSASDQTSGSNSVGTPLYMAPELFEGQEYSRMADLYAVGILLYQMLTGEHPFAPFDFGFIDRVLDEEPDKGSMDARLWPILAQLLAKQSSERFTSALAVVSALAKSLGQTLPLETEAIRESYLQMAHFVGRESELTRLRAALKHAQIGDGSAWLIGGESGVGKTRLIDELHTQALVTGFFVLRGQAIDDSTMPYGLWCEPIRQLVIALTHIEDLAASVLLPLVPDIDQLLGRSVNAAPELNSTAAQARLFTTISRLFQQLDRPLLLILEDLHLTDVSLLLLPYLTRQIDKKQLLIFATYRNDERPGLPDLVPDDMTYLSLERLSSQAMAELSIAMLGEAGTRDDIQILLQKETEGNAFFAVEVVRSLADTAGRLGNIAHMALPKSLLTNGIHGIVEQRLNRLSVQAKQLLVKAAVAGRELDIPLMKKLCVGIDFESEWLSLCADAAVLDFRNQCWQFSHGKIREGVLAELTLDENIKHHTEVAIAIEQLYPADSSQAGRLAFHWQEAGCSEKECHYAEIAGEQAMLKYAYQDALGYYGRVLQLIHPDNLRKRYNIYEACGNAHMLIGDWEKQIDTLEQMTICADQLDCDAKRLATLVKYSDYNQRHRQYDCLEKTISKGIILAQKIGDTERKFHLLNRWTLNLGENRQLETAFESLAECKKIAVQSDDINIRLDFLMTSANLYFYANDLEQCLSFQKEYLHLAEERNELFSIFRGSANMAVNYQTQGEYDLAEKHYLRALQLAHERGDIGSEVFVQVNLTEFYNIIGEFDLAIETGQEALQSSQQIGRSNFYRLALLGIGLAHHKLDSLDEAEDILRDAIQHCQQASDGWNEMLGWNRMGHLQIDRYQFTVSLNAFQNAETLQTDINQITILTEIWSGLAASYLGLGDTDNAKKYADKALVHMQPENINDSWVWDRAYFYIGQILDQMNDERATSVAQQALDAYDARLVKIADDIRRQKYLRQLMLYRSNNQS